VIILVLVFKNKVGGIQEIGGGGPSLLDIQF
jgi:hypothetical protein